jgi:hypothetical protein
MKDWMEAKDFRLVEHLPRADFFLFPTIKRQLVGKVLTQETFKSIWEGATQTLRKRTSPPPSSTGMSAESASASAADTLRNLKK